MQQRQNLDGNASAQAPDAFSITAPIALQDRIAAALFTYSDLFAAARRRLLYMVVWAVLLLSMIAGSSSWRESGRQGIGAFASRFVADLFGLNGLPILLVAVPLLVYYALHAVVVRNRLRRWCRDEGLDQTIDVTYRFEPGGLAVMAAGRRTVLGCSRIQGVAETPEHLFIQLRNIEDVYVLPLRALAGEQTARIKAWAANCHAGAGGEIPALFDLDVRPDEPALLTSRLQLTTEDRAAAIGWQMERPGLRRRRRRGFMLAFLVTALIVPLVFVFLWLLDPARVPFRYAFPLLVEMFIGTFWEYVLGFWALIAVIIVLHPWARRRHAYKLAQRLQKRVHAEEHEIRLYQDRLEVSQDGWRNSFEVASFDRIERQGQHLVLLRREGEPLILPLRALQGNQQALFERVFTGRGGGQNPQAQAQA